MQVNFLYTMSKKSKKNKYAQLKNVIKVPYLKLIIGIIIVIGVALRFLTWNNVVMPDGTIQLKGADAYYFAQEARNVVETGEIPELDKMFCWPDGLVTDPGNLLYSYLLAGASKAMPLEMATALSGPFFSGLAALGIFLILKDLFPDNDFAVIVGTAIASFTGLQYIARSYFGFGDRHVLEVFFAVWSMWAILRAVNFRKWYWAWLAVMFCGLFVLTWDGAPLIIMLFGIGLVINEFTKELDKKTFLYYLLIYFPLSLLGVFLENSTLIMGSLLIIFGIVLIWVLKIKLKTLKQQFIAVICIACVGILGLYLFAPNILNAFLDTIRSFILQDEVSSGISEFQPMFNIYTNIFDPFSKAAVQVFIHGLTIIGFLYMIKRKDYRFLFFGVVLLIISVAKIRGEYYLLIMNAISISYVAKEYKLFAYFAFIVAVYFSMLYWGGEIQNNRNSSLVFTSNDYNMAQWMNANLPSTDNDNYWTITRWDLGYLYGYISKKPIYASPNLCNYLFPSQFFIATDNDDIYSVLREKNIKYIVLKFEDFSKYYSDMEKILGTPPEIIQAAINNQNYFLIEDNYYQTYAARLFNFDGLAVQAKTIYYIDNGSLMNTDNYFEAVLKRDNNKVYGISELESPIDIPALKHFKLIHSEGTGIYQVKLFEVTDN